MSPMVAAPVAAAAEECVPALPADVVSGILAWVPDLVSLFRCAVACKRWRRLVADPAFLRRHLSPEDGGRPSLLGFFVQRHRLSVNAWKKVSKLFPTSAPAFVPAPGSALGPARRFLTSFFRDDAGLLDEAKPLAARGGLLLVRVSPRSGDKNTVLRLCVCNLLTGRRDLVPPLDAAFFNSEGVQGYALLTAADHGAGPDRPAGGYSTFFQVFLIGVARENRHLHLLKFSSAAAASRTWCADNCRRHTAVHLWGPHGCCVAAIALGAAHWLFHGNNPDALSLFTLDVNITTGRISATRLPFDALPHPFRVDLSNAWLCTIDARLALFFFF